MSFRGLIRAAAIGAVALLAAACQTVQTTQPGAIGVNLKQIMMVSAEKVDQGAKVAYDQEVSKARFPQPEGGAVVIRYPLVFSLKNY